jgi:GAF domain-containing protein
VKTQNRNIRYQRIYDQLKGLLTKTNLPEARMSTIVALLHHKMPNFFWTGYYLLHEGELIVGCYQGPLACQVLEKNRGVCWAAIQQQKTIIVPDVNQFPGHIACDSRSKSEIAVPLKDTRGNVRGVLDVDSQLLNNFDETDAKWLEKIVNMIYV